MQLKLKQAYRLEINQAQYYCSKADFKLAFHHLERAHILGQAHYRAHIYSHWLMFKIGLKRSDFREIFGQLIRMLGSVGSLFGKYPVGNTGGADVSPFKVMPIPTDLQRFLD